MKSVALIIFGYNRPNHLKKTINKLQKNKEFGILTKYIFIDGPKNYKDKIKINSIKKFLKKKKFKNCFFSKKNKGLANSIIDGINYVSGKFESFIIVEDDLIVSKNFLTFMINCLNKFEYSKEIFSICGYCYPLANRNILEDDIFISKRFCSWGWATWRNKWKKINFKVFEKKKIFEKKEIQNLDKNIGEDFQSLINAKIKSEIDSWAVIFSYNQFLKKAYSVYPKFSMVKNIGHDNSGTHSKKVNKWNTTLDEKFLPSKFPKKLYFNNNIHQEMLLNFKKNKIKNLFKKILIFKN